MAYDDDHRDLILNEIRGACDAGRLEEASKLLQQATGNLSMRHRRIPMVRLRAALGAGCAARLVKWCTVQHCMMCKSGREVCDVCEGQGEDAHGGVCAECGGMGSRRCPFCNGTAFAGYDFVPVGLRVVVMTGRIRLALARIGELRAKSAAAEGDTAKMIRYLADVERCRGVLANASERARLGDETTPGEAIFTHKAATRLEATCRAANAKAEAIVRRLLKDLASGGGGSRSGVSPARAAFFEKLSESPHLGPSALETPGVFRKGAK